MALPLETQISHLANELGHKLGSAQITVATAESCTGGWVGKAITDVAGSSVWFDRGWVTYSYEAKTELLGVDSAVLVAEGAVSEAVVRQMAEGALARSRAHLAVAVSGIAGPGGATPDKPVGTIWFAWAVRAGASAGASASAGAVRVEAEQMHFDGDREAVRAQSVVHALQGLLNRAD